MAIRLQTPNSKFLIQKRTFPGNNSFDFTENCIFEIVLFDTHKVNYGNDVKSY